MSYTLRDDWKNLSKELIRVISNYNDDSEPFKHLEKGIAVHLAKADNLFYISQKELDRTIVSLSDKFIFHGFSQQANDLKRLYEKLTPQTLSKHDRLNRMNVIKFLLCIAESPTNNFHKYPQRFEKGDEEDIIDWPNYLKEGIPRWSPPKDDETSDNESDLMESVQMDGGDSIDHCKYDFETSSNALVDLHDPFVDYHLSKANLLKTVQSEWFKGNYVCYKPLSDDRDANIALLWDDFVEQTTKGLVPMQHSNIISEYKVMREIIWQLYEPHSSMCFQIIGNSLTPNLNITIASVRKEAFQSFLYEFIPYIEWLQTLRDFHESLIIKYDDDSVVVPDTYKSYDFALQTIIQPIIDKLKTIENKIKVQETTSTLLTLANEIRPFFQIVKILKDIHCHVVLDFKTNSPLNCTTTLLWRLHQGLFYSSSKLEQDLYLTLYLHSLYKYFTLINSWLGRDILEDRTDEFVIADDNPKDPHVLSNQSFSAIPQNQIVCCKSKVKEGEQDWQMEFSVKEIDENAKADSIISIISSQVLQIGKNIHLLRLLGRIHLVPEFTGVYKETLYETYLRKVLENISMYFDVKDEVDEVLDGELDVEPTSPTFVFPATCPDQCKYLTEMDKLENLVDTTNGFLLQAFETFLIKKPTFTKLENERSLFQRITKLTQDVFPAQHIIGNVFIEILKERFTMSGMMVKNVLIIDYNLEKQFEFLNNVFLFKDDLIFPFYRRIFQQLDADGLWGNHTWLTSYLQDIIMDAYPNFYEECSVDVKENWKLCTDPLKACKMISVHYRIRWPVNIIIRDEHMEMYKDLFQFVLKIKWALYTLNHLYFTEHAPKGKSIKNQPKSLRMLISKLKILRFGLINIFSSIQHYILGHIFHKFWYKFEKAFEEAYDLESLVRAHGDFIQSLHRVGMEFQEYNGSSHGFYLLLYLVRKLRSMWRDLRNINDEDLEKYQKLYWMCHKEIDPIINPTSYRAYISYEL